MGLASILSAVAGPVINSIFGGGSSSPQYQPAPQQVIIKPPVPQKLAYGPAVAPQFTPTQANDISKFVTDKIGALTDEYTTDFSNRRGGNVDPTVMGLVTDALQNRANEIGSDTKTQLGVMADVAGNQANNATALQNYQTDLYNTGNTDRYNTQMSSLNNPIAIPAAPVQRPNQTGNLLSGIIPSILPYIFGKGSNNNTNTNSSALV